MPPGLSIVRLTKTHKGHQGTSDHKFAALPARIPLCCLIAKHAHAATIIVLPKAPATHCQAFRQTRRNQRAHRGRR